MEKKSTVITPKGYTIKVADHMLSDLAKFGATTQRPVLKPTPKEILNMPKKVVKIESNLPEMGITEKTIEVVPDYIPELANGEPVKTPLAEKFSEAAKKVRKTPVRSKSKA